jgi:hypothetical protein
VTDRRRANLTATLGFLQLPPRESELRLLHRAFDSWAGLGLIATRYAARRLGSPAHRVRRRPLAGDFLRDWDGALDRGRIGGGGDAVARRTEGRMDNLGNG